MEFFKATVEDMIYK